MKGPVVLGPGFGGEERSRRIFFALLESLLEMLPSSLSKRRRTQARESSRELFHRLASKSSNGRACDVQKWLAG